MQFDLSVKIRRTPTEALAFMADIQRYNDDGTGSRVPVMEKIPAGPTRVGTRWREVVRVAPFLRMTIWSEVTAYEPARRLAESFRSSWMSGVLEYTVEPTADGTLLRQRETLTPRGPLRLLDGLIARPLRPNLVGRLEEIRALLESGVAVE